MIQDVGSGRLFTVYASFLATNKEGGGERRRGRGGGREEAGERGGGGEVTCFVGSLEL